MDLHKIQAGSLKLLGDGLIPLTEFAAECGGTVADVARRLRDRQARFYVRAKNLQGWFCPVSRLWLVGACDLPAPEVLDA